MLIWILVILLMILTAPVWLPIVVPLATGGLKILGAFLFCLAFWGALFLLAALAYPVAHHVAVWLGPQFMEDYGDPAAGTAVILATIIGWIDITSDYILAKTAWHALRALFQSKTWVSWWKRYRIFPISGTSCYAPYLWLARLHARRLKPARIQKRKDLCAPSATLHSASSLLPRTVTHDRH